MKRYLLLTLPLACLVFFVDAQKHTKPHKPITGKAWNLPLPGNKNLGMSWIRPGTFVIGSPATEAGHKADESPQTTVTLTKGYWMATTF